MRQNQSLKASSNLAAFVILIALSLCSCVPKNKTSTRLKVVASVPVIYDWTRSLMDESTNTRLFLNLIIKNGLNFHNLVPGETEEIHPDQRTGQKECRGYDGRRPPDEGLRQNDP